MDEGAQVSLSKPRFAIYFTPAPESPLAVFGNAVLGYDPCTGGSVSRPGLPLAVTSELDEIVREPSRYGFHATLKAPMRLRGDITEQDLLRAARAFAKDRPAVKVGRVDVRAIDGFCALVPSLPHPALDLFAAECVAYFDPLRRDLSDMERERRLQQPLSARELALLDRWGYPHVFDRYRFHMTLTQRLPEELRDLWLTRLRDAYSGIADQSLVIEAISVMRQDSEAAFRVLERIPLQ